MHLIFPLTEVSVVTIHVTGRTKSHTHHTVNYKDNYLGIADIDCKWIPVWYAIAKQVKRCKYFVHLRSNIGNRGHLRKITML